MPRLGLRPFAIIEEGLDQYLGYNFNRLENVFERIKDVTGGFQVITGTATITTGLSKVDGCLVGFRADPVAGAAYVSAIPSASSGLIVVRVLTNGFALSVTAISIQWQAFGEMVLS